MCTLSTTASWRKSTEKHGVPKVDVAFRRRQHHTWDVLPDHLKTGDIVYYVCRELEWVKGQLV